MLNHVRPLARKPTARPNGDFRRFSPRRLVWGHLLDQAMRRKVWMIRGGLHDMIVKSEMGHFKCVDHSGREINTADAPALL